MDVGHLEYTRGTYRLVGLLFTITTAGKYGMVQIKGNTN